MKRRITKHSAFAGALMGVFVGLLPASILAQKTTERKSPPCTVVVALETTSPFVGDGRMTFADFAFSATFKDVVFVFDPAAAFEFCESAPASKDGLVIVPLVPPEKAKLRFHAEFGLLDLMWFSKLGSNALSDMFFEFEVPWLKLLDGKPLTLKLPYQSTDPDEKGEWWIEFIPKKKG